MVAPTDILRIWNRLHRLPFGKRLFSSAIGRAAPYTGTLPFVVEELEAGRSVVRLKDRRIARNHLRSLHAIALMNLGEVATGLAMYSTLPAGARGIITSLSMDYLKKARGPITASCTAEPPSGSGRHDLNVTASLRNRAGVEVAVARAVWRVDLP